MTFSHTKTDTPTQSPFHRHMHSDYEILYFVEGDADYVVESAVYRLQRRDLLLIAPRTYHHLRLRSSSRYERFVINFSEAELGGELSPILPGEDCIFNIPKDSFINHFFDFSQNICDFLKRTHRRIAFVGFDALDNTQAETGIVG